MSNQKDDSTSAFTADKLKTLLKEKREQKTKLQKSIQDVDQELKRLYSKNSKRPRETVDQLQKEISALEYKRTTKSMSLASEKSILKEIAAVQRTKSQVEEYHANERLMQEKKAQVASMRDSLKNIIAEMHELEGAVAKAEMAERLHCTLTELRTETISCPADKVGRVIGKGGSMVNQISEKSGAKIDVSSSKRTIDLTGSTQAIEAAKKEIDCIVRAVEVRVEVSDELLCYLSNRHITKVDELRRQHPDVLFEIPRNQSVVVIRGLPEHVERAKSNVTNLSVDSETLLIDQKESGVVLGKKGSRVENLTKKYGVVIRVENGKSNDVASVTAMGPSSNAKDCIAAIDHMLAENRDVTEYVEVSSIVRSTVLMDGGVPIKQMQKTINDKTRDHGGSVLLSFGEKGRLKMRGRRAAIDIALPIVQETITFLEASVVTVDLDPEIVPRVIGKGGSNIRELQKEYKGVVVEIENSGKAFIHGSDTASVEAIQRRLQEIAASNQLCKIDCPSGSFRIIYRDLMKAKGDELKAILSSVDMDESSCQILLRGSPENFDKASAIVSEYLEENYVEDVEYATEDEPVLVAGGKESIISTIAAEHGVAVSLVRSRAVVMVRGVEARVKIAAKRLQQFLTGGEGRAIARLSLTEHAIGVIVGKGGAKRAELEEKHAVSIYVSNSNRVAIRGPEDGVEACRIDILHLVAAVRVQESLPITPDQRVKLTKPRQIIKGIPVDIMVTDDAVKVRGISADVKDALALVKEQLTGVYESRIELDTTQVSKLRSACRDPAHFYRIKNSSNAQVVLDLATGAVVITGKRNNVSKAKSQVMDLLDFLLPSNFAHLKISKPLHSTVGSAASLAAVAVQTGASVLLDRDISMIHIHSSAPARVEAAVSMLQPKIYQAEQLVYTYHFEASEDWLLPLIIGKGGARVNALRDESGCQIDISKENITVTLSGPDSESFDKAKQSLEEMVEQARRENAFVEIPGDAIAPFLGKSFKHMKEFAEEHGVEMDRLRKEPNTIKIAGLPENVEAAKKAVEEWIAEYEDKHASLTIPVNRVSIPAIVGKEGSVIASLQREFDCRLEIDRGASTVTIVGGSSEKREQVTSKIKVIVTEDQEKHAAARRKAVAAVEDKENPASSLRNNDTAPETSAADKGRSSEFAPLPVGMTIEDKVSKRRSSCTTVDSSVQTGTAAGRNLFDLLVSDSTTAPRGSNRAVTLMVPPEENWDSSTVSSAIVETASNTDESITDEATAEEKSYFKSASGFTVRV